MSQTNKTLISNDPDNVVWVDVDYTLISPLDVDSNSSDSINKRLIALIKVWHAKGRTIVVWTSNTGGTEHAKRAVDLCGLIDYVHFYFPKPKFIVDDDHLEYYRTMDPMTLTTKEAST